MRIASSVIALLQILKDVRSIAFIMFLVMAGFRHMFATVLSSSGSTQGDADSEPFGEVPKGFLILYNMMLGDFDMSLFEAEEQSLHEFAKLIFVFFMFIVQVMMVNVLIAVVCESYAIAQGKARALFFRERLLLAAELDTMGFTSERYQFLSHLMWWFRWFLMKHCPTEEGSEEVQDYVGRMHQNLQESEQRLQNSMAEAEARMEKKLAAVTDTLNIVIQKLDAVHSQTAVVHRSSAHSISL